MLDFVLPINVPPTPPPRNASVHIDVPGAALIFSGNMLYKVDTADS